MITRIKNNLKLGVQMDLMYRKQQKRFEAWSRLQFKGNLDLTEDTAHGGYMVVETNCLWIGFCAGLEIAKIQRKYKSVIAKILNWLKPKSPCCNEVMTSCLEMELNKMLYECTKCNKQFI